MREKWTNVVHPVDQEDVITARLVSSASYDEPAEPSSAPMPTKAADPLGSTFPRVRASRQPALQPPSRHNYSGGEGLERILKARDGGQGCCGATEYWPETLFAVQGRSFPLWPMVAYTVYSAAAVCFVVFFLENYKDNHTLQGLITPLQNVGYALFLLLTFRTQSTYERWWDGRRQLGAINAGTRDIARYCVSHLRGDKELAERLVRWTIAFVVAVKCTLRREHARPFASIEPEHYRELRDVLAAEELAEMLSAPHKPSYCSWRISTYLANFIAQQRAANQLVDVSDKVVLETSLSSMVQASAATERIVNTPMPFSILCHLRSFLVLWLAAVPFVFVASLQWLTIGFCVIVGYALLGFESIGVEIEAPFGRDYNDLPMDQISDGIKANLMGALQYMATTNAAGAVTSQSRLLAMRSGLRASVKTDLWGVPEESDAPQIVVPPAPPT